MEYLKIRFTADTTYVLLILMQVLLSTSLYFNDGFLRRFGADFLLMNISLE